MEGRGRFWTHNGEVWVEIGLGNAGRSSALHHPIRYSVTEDVSTPSLLIFPFHSSVATSSCYTVYFLPVSATALHSPFSDPRSPEIVFVLSVPRALTVNSYSAALQKAYQA